MPALLCITLNHIDKATEKFIQFIYFFQKLRNLENRLDKANLKCREAQHITHTYLQIKCKLEDEHQTFESILDEMEVEIKRYK